MKKAKMKEVISEGLFVLCYVSDNSLVGGLKLSREIGPYYTAQSAFGRAYKERDTKKYKHVEVGERVKFK